MPTALELTRKGWQPYIEAAKKHFKPLKPTAADRQLRERLLARIDEVAAMLKSRYGARRVILFGSLADEDWIPAGSDVDLAVEGLTAETYWQAWSDAEAIIADFPVTLIELESAREGLVYFIQQYGISLLSEDQTYEADQSFCQKGGW